MKKSATAGSNLRGRLLIVALVVMTFGPFYLAWYMAQHPEWLGKTTNYGELIVPPKPTGLAELAVSARTGELAHRWVMVQLAPAGRCDEACRDALHRGKQVWLRLSKDMPRVHRLLLGTGGEIEGATAQALRQEDETLHLAKATPELQRLLETEASAAGPSATLWLIDPLGNVMMRYPLDYDPHGLLRDLQQLLKVSTAG